MRPPSARPRRARDGGPRDRLLMHCALVMTGVPALGNHGGALTCWGIVRGLLDVCDQVTVVSLFDRSASNPYLSHAESNRRALSCLGVNLETVEFGAELFARPATGRQLWAASKALQMLSAPAGTNLATLYPFARLRPAVTTTLERLAPDVVF